MFFLHPVLFKIKSFCFAYKLINGLHLKRLLIRICKKPLNAR